MLNQHQQIFEQIEKAKSILIAFSKDWSGDAVASSLALFLYLKKQGKDVEVAADQPNQKSVFSFLPSFSSIQNSLSNLRKFIVSLDITNAKVGQIKYKLEDNTLNFIISPKEGFFTHDDISSRSGEFKYDLVITLDTPDLESLGKIYDNDTEFFYHVPIINIDHHSNNESFGQINLIELTAISTTQIIYKLFMEKNPELLDADIATCLLAGVIAKTRSFKTQNITPESLSISSELISLGARREEIVNTLYRSRSINCLKLWGRILARLKSELENQLVWSVLSRSDFEKTETTVSDLEEVIDELIINIPQAKIIVLIHESLGEQISAAKTEVLIYSVKNLNSVDLAKSWQGHGTRTLARFTVDKNLAQSEDEVIGKLKNEIINIIG